MGFFKRKDPADQAQSSKRAAVPSEVQAAELRGRARRRLAGAVALVLAAVIILPMVLDSQPTPVDDNIPIRVPERNTPFQPQVTEPQVAAPQTPAPGSAAPTDPSAIPTPPPVTSVQPPATTTPPAAQPATPPATAAVTPPKPEPKPATPPKPDPKPATPAKPDNRSDDGARALALLEGRSAPAASAPAPKPAAKGNFVLQIAAYTTAEDAQSRRGKLHQAGVTNAFVEQATINGKQQYRLRVGPFPSREAAQAAQARLRTLGYDNGFIAAQ
ncbi:SPOR domain-containing protein [Achromobacter sp. K91]|jgi:DedD protein|uniref:SPOR domain-containing protein n=1 Tax=unclassified Achromobacter TaxID=2626865 RepID=UPI000E668DC2|nr:MULTISPECIES: SPOR domain-containing protein [unclassified Achromobacter]MBD9379823.1 SPOR domain-containing protein [Achromobacter sp. ACM02]RII99744.1 SPOR domain-containing protein [Achromobacter sp. K91]